MNIVVFANTQDYVEVFDSTNQQILKVNNKEIKVNIRSDNGKYYVTTDYALNGHDSQDIIKALNEYADSLNSASVSPNSWTSGWDQWVASAHGTNSYANVMGGNTVKFDHPTSTKVDVTAKGSIAGYWTGSGTPSYIRLVQNLTVSGTSVTISWPPSFSSSGSTATYASDPFYSTTYAYSPYTGMYGFSYVALYSYTQADQAIVRINNTDYRANSSIYTNWLTGECITTPTGSSVHTSGL